MSMRTRAFIQLTDSVLCYSYVTALEDRIERFERLFKRVRFFVSLSSAFIKLLNSYDPTVTLQTFLGLLFRGAHGKLTKSGMQAAITDKRATRVQEPDIPFPAHLLVFICCYPAKRRMANMTLSRKETLIQATKTFWTRTIGPGGA